jgi:hypothetical protein
VRGLEESRQIGRDRLTLTEDFLMTLLAESDYAWVLSVLWSVKRGAASITFPTLVNESHVAIKSHASSKRIKNEGQVQTGL